MTQGDVLRTLLPRYLNRMRFTNPSNGYHTAIMMRLDSFPLSATTNFQNFYSIPIEGSLSFNLYALILMLSSLIQTAPAGNIRLPIYFHCRSKSFWIDFHLEVMQGADTSKQSDSITASSSPGDMNTFSTWQKHNWMCPPFNF
jgi:hypothetical protein